MRLILCFIHRPHSCHCIAHPQDGNSPLHVVAGRGNYDALRVFLTHVELPDMNCTNKVPIEI